MEIIINGTATAIPTNLMDVTLSQFIGYWETSGKQMDESIATALKADYDDPFMRDLALIELEWREAVGWYSYFTGFDFSTVANAEADLLMEYFRIIKDGLIESETAAYTFPQYIHWMNDEWEISDWRVSPTSKFTFNELLTAKEITRQIHAIGKSKWDALPYLCAVFLRKRGEVFTDELVMEGSARLQQMRDLPMFYALQVAFFLNVSIITLARVSAYSKDPAVELIPQ